MMRREQEISDIIAISSLASLPCLTLSPRSPPVGSREDPGNVHEYGYRSLPAIGTPPVLRDGLRTPAPRAPITAPSIAAGRRLIAPRAGRPAPGRRRPASLPARPSALRRRHSRRLLRQSVLGIRA